MTQKTHNIHDAKRLLLKPKARGKKMYKSFLIIKIHHIPSHINVKKIQIYVSRSLKNNTNVSVIKPMAIDLMRAANNK